MVSSFSGGEGGAVHALRSRTVTALALPLSVRLGGTAGTLNWPSTSPTCAPSSSSLKTPSPSSSLGARFEDEELPGGALEDAVAPSLGRKLEMENCLGSG